MTEPRQQYADPAADSPGERPSWEDVARTHGRFIYSVAYRLTGNHHDAQDLVQEVLLRVRRGLAGYQPGNLEGWLGRITTNAFLDRVRREQRRPSVPLPEDTERLVVGSSGIDEEMAAGDLPQHLQDLLADLNPDFRIPVVMKDVFGYSYEEIADRLDLPIGTVRSRIHRGRGRLREAMAA